MLAKNSAENMLPNILLVDDLKENLYALKKILEVLKVNIDLASSGNEALQKNVRKTLRRYYFRCANASHEWH